MKYDPVDTWIDSVCASHSNSNRTRYQYKFVINQFCKFIETTGIQILEEYKVSTDRDFKMEYAQCIKAFIAAQHKKGIAQSTISVRVGVLKSFFKYNDLPLGFIPTVKPIMPYHNRDITHEEIKLILDSSRPRERAFFAIMAQSGLRPYTICKLKYENIKEDWEKKRVPCKIEIPQEIAKGKYHSHFTFIGDDAVKHLKSYLNFRPKILDEDYLFLKDGTKEQANPKSISRFFARIVKKLHEKGLMKLKQKKVTKPHDVRLYNLRKWFRKYANQADFGLVQFWMGHTVKAGQDEHYRPRDVEFHRKEYAEKAMPYLRLENATRTKTDKAIITLEQENRELKVQIEKLETTMQKMYQKVFHEEIEQEKEEKYLDEHPEISEKCEREIKAYEEMRREEEEYLAKHPEELKRQAEKDKKIIEEYEKYLEEHAEQVEQEIKYGEEHEIRVDEKRKTLRELQDIIKKSKETKKNKI